MNLSIKDLARWRQWLLSVVAIACVMLLGQTPAFALHPMDGLTADEYQQTVALLQQAALVSESSRYPTITLKDPPKAEMLAWEPGQPFERSAFVVVKEGTAVYEAVVNLTQETVESWEPIEGVQAGILLEEWLQVQEIAQSDPDWQAAIAQRGITADEYEDIICVPLSAGYFADPAEEGRRLFRVTCFDGRDAKNFWGRPIEGLLAIVDINEEKVFRLIDTGPVPIPDSPVDYDEEAIAEMRPESKVLQLVERGGHEYTLNDNTVNWQNWQFHYRIDPRVGPILSQVQYNDQGTMRSVLYEGALSEMFVPYMSPKAGWYFRSYMDAGEYGAGKLAVPLVRSRDCPSTAVYIDALFADESGTPYTQPRAACIFERYAGDVLWRHYEALKDESESRRARELVFRFITAIGNYDYIFDWVFSPNGSITVTVGASGTEEVEAVMATSVDDPDDPHATDYGRMVSPNIVATNHDHYFSFRLDMDVDGTNNSFVYDALETQAIGRESPRTSVWTTTTHTAKTESDAKMRMSLEHPKVWRIANPSVQNWVGYPTSYEIMGMGNALSLMRPDDYPQQRAGFIDYHLWVTPYSPDELYAAGDYPNQSHGGDGLPAWTSQDRPIEDTDIVAWYTLGFHHVVRAEDWPVLPTEVHQFQIKPFDFFDRNPAIDVPESA
jgi:primary-amine oxidase